MTEKSCAAQLIDTLRDRADEIPGARLQAPGVNVWLHTNEQVRGWLLEVFLDIANDRGDWLAPATSRDGLDGAS